MDSLYSARQSLASQIILLILKFLKIEIAQIRQQTKSHSPIIFENDHDFAVRANYSCVFIIFKIVLGGDYHSIIAFFRVDFEYIRHCRTCSCLRWDESFSRVKLHWAKIRPRPYHINHQSHIMFHFRLISKTLDELGDRVDTQLGYPNLHPNSLEVDPVLRDKIKSLFLALVVSFCGPANWKWRWTRISYTLKIIDELSLPFPNQKTRTV